MVKIRRFQLRFRSKTHLNVAAESNECEIDHE